MAEYSEEEKIRICELVLNEGRSRRSVALEFGVRPATVSQWVRRHEAGEPFDKRVFNGREPLLTDADLDRIEEWVTEDPRCPVSVLLTRLTEERQVDVSADTLRRGMRRRGIRCLRPLVEEAVPPSAEEGSKAEWRYAAQHRRQPALRYPSSLTDREWEILEPLMESTRPTRGRPAEHDERVMLDAIFYVLRSGCAWRMLPSEFPPWETVYAAFRSWTRSGRMEAIYKRLHEQWRSRAGRKTTPSAAIVDSQSVKTTEKGGLEATTAARRSRAGSAT